MPLRKVDVTVGTAKLRDSLRTLEAKWERTCECWHDEVQRRFEEEHLMPIEPRVLTAVSAISTLVQILAKAQEECE